MALPKSFEKKADCPEFLHEYFDDTTDGGLTIKSGYELDNVANLKSALGESKEKGKKLLTALKPYGAIEEGTWDFEAAIDPAAVADLAKQVETYKTQLKDKPDPNELAKSLAADNIAALKQTYEEKIAELNTTSKTSHDELMADFHKVAIDQQIDSAIASAGGKPNMLRPYLKELAKLDDDRHVVLMRDGKAMINNDAKNLSISELLGQMSHESDWKPAFNAPATKGGGSAQPVTDFSGAAAPALDRGAFFVD